MTSSNIFAEPAKPIILVLGSGGSKGLAHVGVIEELEKLKIIPDIIVGCSSGAIVGAMYALTKDSQFIKKCLIDLSASEIVDYSLFQKGAISTRVKLTKFLDKHFKDKVFSDTKIKLVIVSTDFETGMPVYFSEGSIQKATLASCALPGLFPPLEYNGKIYIDGGCSSPLPISYANKIKGEGIVIASDVSGSLSQYEGGNLIYNLRKSFEIIYQNLIHFSKEQADVVISSLIEDVKTPIDDQSNLKIYLSGKKAVINHLPELKKAKLIPH